MRLPRRIRVWRSLGRRASGAASDWNSKAARGSGSPLPSAARDPVNHVVIIDGSLSSLQRGQRTHAGRLYRLLCELAPRRDVSIHYQHGIQFPTWSTMRDVIEGRGINRQIRAAYGALASRYQPGDRIYLFGYSRGAYAVRSLAGVIDRVGLLRAEHATERAIKVAYRHYERGGSSATAGKFRRLYCHPPEKTPIEMIGVWDTVKALGLRLPIIWRWTEPKHHFHSHALGAHVRHAYHALALDERRLAFAPVLWDGTADFPGTVQQMWFRGRHGDVGGQLSGYEAARPLSNIPLTWMLSKAESCALPLPEGWRARFPCDACAPSIGPWRGWGPIFLSRRPRVVGRDPSEAMHSTVTQGATIPLHLAKNT